MSLMSLITVKTKLNVYMFCVTQVYQGHTLEKTYLGEDFFWAVTPTAGDYVLFKFDRPVSIER